MTREEAISVIERLAHVESKWHGTEDTLDALDMAVSALRPVSREQVERMRSGWITVAETNGKQYSKCADCQNALDGLEDAYLFCPHCGAPMTDEAVQMVMERLKEAISE